MQVESNMGIQQKYNPNVVLTMVDLKVMDSQSFKDSHTRFMNVKRLTQLWVRYTVHSANLEGQTVSQTYRQADRYMQRHGQTVRWTDTCMWSFRRKACSFLYSLEAEFLLPNVKLINQRWWANLLWTKQVTPHQNNFTLYFCIILNCAVIQYK